MDIQAIKNRFGIIGNSPALNYALQVAVQVANTDLTVLINGESGVGKEVFSQIIHALSARKHNPFIAVNCGAIPEGTIDSELFGHEKGSFTGAVDSRKGYFETVNGGTIFLDEIGEMPMGTQARLLRVLETGEYIRVGSSKVQKTDVRVVAATNRDLLERTQQGKFREDLYYRLNTVPIRVPALRDRKEDIPLLFRKFSVDFSEKYKTPSIQLDEEARNILVNYPWRGNIRELKNIAEQISVLATDKLITAADLRRFLPEQPEVNRLPVLAPQTQQQGGDFASERDILYKLFFDMKKDVTEVKKMFFDILQNPNIAHSADFHPDNHVLHSYSAPADVAVPSPGLSPAQPIILADNKIDHHEEVEETLSIADKEKELIVKALKKHKGKRKDAALDLGISERTLYRKLKEYNIAE
ncbi:regulatory protein, Fis family [Chitinophaga terrae (ex Kim and Jung 2007)]|uniref:Regulatory protein, Fis family n=1 Tax=Chitinophaga terrae (ex Kim and Jung 2007) TaxID=408074 RepID=A0A1H3YNQ0_9BACT|nr:sigma-54 dependent transcriptional regulator [Chitinophaga terrae (ex Kim and Jung 2007)]MDQ0107116.1 DNA-binding NtrC family response regulator [Chitinophaga terrae (ex Kim and Jung 2007)]GEP88420.1 sigma-54-dependent Fis family transcriptional regulator [Chitinophaga terrae (ex Kim and Jung 2007)]SEA13176.1 regulatory protein, Fis family [Chitinophaga terrae (ex Kim and Jung 2007)]